MKAMRQIQMVDLRAQYEKIEAEIDTVIKKVIQASSFIKGPDVKIFEDSLASYLGSRHCIACANGTDALQIALMALGLKPGDEVITTNFTFISTVEVVALLGLKVVLVDPDPDTYNITAANIVKAINPRTRAIVPVHLFGQCADMEEIMKIAARHNLFVIEDAAQASGTDYYFSDGTVKKAGTIGTIGTTSFFPSKNLGCYGDGGAMFTSDDRLAEKMRSIANHGMKIKYQHNDIGINSRLDTLQAAILNVKLPHLDDYNKARRAAADYYDRALARCNNIVLPARSSFSSHIFHQYTLRVKDGRRDQLKAYLAGHGIPSMVYYPGPLHIQEAYRFLGYSETDLPVTTMLCNSVLSLPMHPELEEDQLEHIVSHVLKFFE